MGKSPKEWKKWIKRLHQCRCSNIQFCGETKPNTVFLKWVEGSAAKKLEIWQQNQLKYDSFLRENDEIVYLMLSTSEIIKLINSVQVGSGQHSFSRFESQLGYFLSGVYMSSPKTFLICQLVLSLDVSVRGCRSLCGPTRMWQGEAPATLRPRTVMKWVLKMDENWVIWFYTLFLKTDTPPDTPLVHTYMKPLDQGSATANTLLYNYQWSPLRWLLLLYK